MHSVDAPTGNNAPENTLITSVAQQEMEVQAAPYILLLLKYLFGKRDMALPPANIFLKLFVPHTPVED